MSDVKHTALPWRIGDVGRTVFGPPNGKPAPEIVAHTTRANARYIQQACNAYPALVEALERIANFKPGMTDKELTEASGGWAALLRNQARAALAQAQGDE